MFIAVREVFVDVAGNQCRGQVGALEMFLGRCCQSGAGVAEAGKSGFRECRSRIANDDNSTLLGSQSGSQNALSTLACLWKSGPSRNEGACPEENGACDDVETTEGAQA